MLTAGLVRSWQIASVIFFAYIVGAAIARPRLPHRNRRQATVAAGAGLALGTASVLVPFSPLLHGWLIPPALLLLAYWTSGRLFVAPMPAVEQALMRLDCTLRIRSRAARAPRLVAEALEISYAGVYPLIPVGLATFLLRTPGADPDRFWTVVLATDFVCFGVLPWVQTRPPRVLEGAGPWRSTFRSVNLRLLGAASIHVNTFPSGHAAEALAVALLVSAAPLPYAGAMFIAAAAIAAGAVGGRYHYAADAILGWTVALIVWGAL